MNETDDLPALRRVLVADDEHLVAAGLVSSLSALGYEVIGPASDGAAALDLAVESGAQLALLDIRMPRLDGLETASRLWAEHEIPSVAVSAYSSEQYVEKAQQSGVFGYLLKPVTRESLQASIAVAWSRAFALTSQRGRTRQLESTLANRRVVEQAKWRMVEQLGLSENEAHTALQRTARSRRLKLAEVAQHVLEEDQDRWDLEPAAPTNAS